VLVTWKVAEDEMGTVLRFVEVGGMSGTATISTPLITAEPAWLCNAVEEDETPLEVSSQGVTVPFRPHQILTIRLQGKPAILPN
jgi:alpha-mannosidase